MKRLVSFLPSFFLRAGLLLSMVLTACIPASSPTQVADVPEPTVVITEEPQSAPQSAMVEETPLPEVSSAPLIEAPSIINIEMLDEVNGWALTDENIVRTDDGGVTWYDVTPAKFADAGYMVFPEFFDANIAWVQFTDMTAYPNGGTLHHTTDGGLTWESFPTPFSGGVFHFIDEQNGWIMADLGVGAGSMAVSIFQTSDSGRTWNRTYTNDPNLEGAGESLPLGGIKNIMIPLNEQTLWVGGVVYAPGTVYLFRSDDGGKTWAQVELTLPEGAGESELGVEDLRFISRTQGILKLRIASTSSRVVLYTTGDGGDTWSPLSTTFEGGGVLDVPSAEEMIFYTADQFHVTTDAGRTFNTLTPDVKFGDTVIDMSFADSKIGWIVTADLNNERALYKTTDGGSTWTVLVP